MEKRLVEERGFDKNGLWHKKLSDGSYSMQAQEFDEFDKDCYGFEKGCRSTVEINGWHKTRSKASGRIKYIFGENRTTDWDGYDINGFNEQGFNRNGIHKSSGIKYNLSGIKFDGRKPKAFPINEAIDKAYTEKDKSSLTQEQWRDKKNAQIKLFEFLVLSKKNKNISNEAWYKVAESKIGDNLEKTVKKSSTLFRKGKNNIIKEKNETIKQNNEIIKEEELKRNRGQEIKAKYERDIKNLRAALKEEWRKKI